MLSLFVTILKLRHSLIPTIYIVDDEEATSRMFAKYLQTKGYRVVVSPSAIQFLSVFEPEQRGCIVIDERMPELSGLQALESIAKWLPIYPAILLTGYADVSLTVKVMKTGAFDVLEKPIEPDVLLAKIEQALGWALEVWERHSADVQVDRGCWSQLPLSLKAGEFYEIVHKKGFYNSW
jgi:FixJ family two-component response regulator